MAGWADSSLWAHWGSLAAEERKHWPSCCLELTKERNQHSSKRHQCYIHWFFGWLFLALHCLSPSYHFLLPTPKVKWEAAARSLLRAPFLRSPAEGRALPSPPAWWPTALTFRARCQLHLLTQAFANKGSSPCIALSFEDASSSAYFLLLPNIWCWNSWIQDGGAVLMGKHQTLVFISDLSPYNRFWQPQTWKMLMFLHSLLCPKKFHTEFWIKCVFPFFCLLFRKPEDSLPKQRTRVNALQGNPGRQAHKGLPALERICSGGNLAGPKSSLITLFTRKRSSRLIFPYRIISFRLCLSCLVAQAVLPAPSKPHKQ